MPLDFFVEGFSKENTSYMLMDAPCRLMLAYLLSLVRSSLILSPVAWVSWALQVLATAYLPAGLVLNYFLIFIGLATIRLISLVQSDIGSVESGDG